MKQENCRLCLHPLSDPILKFPDTPLANEFLKTKETQDKFPLQVCCCDNCGHYQLNETVDPERLFRHYLFVAGTSKVNVEHFRKYANTIYDNCLNKSGNRKLKALDIASNDGILLQHLKNLGVDVLGIDPAKNIADEATKNGIPTIPEFFTEEYSYEILAKYGKFDIITANNVFAHVPDMIGFIKGVRNLLDYTGIFSFEVSYFGDVCDKTLFDTIYHEHTSYHTLTPLKDFLFNHGLQLCNVEKIDTHGGSIRVHAWRSDINIDYQCDIDTSNPQRNDLSCQHDTNNLNISIMLAEEKYIQLRASKLIQDIQKLGVNLNNQLKMLKQDGLSIAVYGTPAKATTLMYALDIDESIIDFAVEDAPLKQGTFTPGKHIPVFSFSTLLEKKPDVVLILAWNFADSIIEKCKANGYKGRLIIPLPKLKVIDIV